MTDPTRTRLSKEDLEDMAQIAFEASMDLTEDDFFGFDEPEEEQFDDYGPSFLDSYFGDQAQA